MSHQLLNHNVDLQQLRTEGYAVCVVDGYLILRDVPYVDENRNIKRGDLISTLNLAGDRTQKPDTHVVHFTGSFPCDANGKRLDGIAHVSGTQRLGDGLVSQHSFSSKPATGYKNYHHKMSTYASIVAGPAGTVDSAATARVRRVDGYDDPTSVFHYSETSTARAGISGLNRRLTSECIAIIGLGGTGSYVLDLVTKTPVSEIRLFDGDDFLQHNAFRAPGAASLDELRKVPSKVHYFSDQYTSMHRNIVTHQEPINESNLHLLDGVTFAFICVDSGSSRQLVVSKLEEMGISFIDVGMGIENDEGSLGGILRVTASTPENRKYMHDGHVSFEDSDIADEYDSNIQIAEFNSMNAAMAVVKWKKLRGYYRDMEKELHSTYTTDGNMLLNGGVS